MLSVALPSVLRIAALVLAVAGTFGYFVFGQPLAPPSVVALVLFALSLAARRRQRAVALLSMGLSILLPIESLLAYLRGDLVVAVPIFDLILFAWVFGNALHAARVPKNLADA